MSERPCYGLSSVNPHPLGSRLDDCPECEPVGKMIKFPVGGAFFVNLLGIGEVAAEVETIMSPETRPAYVIGAKGYNVDVWGVDDHQQWIASWQALAGLHGMLDALRAHIPPELKPEYAELRRTAFPVGRDALAEAAAAFAADPCLNGNCSDPEAHAEGAHDV